MYNETLQHRTQRKGDGGDWLPSSSLPASSTPLMKEIKRKPVVALPPLRRLPALQAAMGCSKFSGTYLPGVAARRPPSCCPRPARRGCEQPTLRSVEGCRRCGSLRRRGSLRQQGPRGVTSAAFLVQRPAPAPVRHLPLWYEIGERCCPEVLGFN